MPEIAPANQQPEVGDLAAAHLADFRAHRAAAVQELRKDGVSEAEIVLCEYRALEKMAKDRGIPTSAITAETIVQRAAR